MNAQSASRAEENSRLTQALSTAEGEERAELLECLTVLNMDVARSISRRFARRGESSADLEQVAYLALFRSSRDFDLQRGEHFLPYAVACIRGALRHHFRDDVWMVRPSREVQTHHNELRKLGHNHTSDGVAIETCYRPLSLDVPLGATGDLTLASFVEEDTDQYGHVELRESLRPALAALSPRARVLLHLRYVQDKTQAEIGDVLGVSQFHVSRLLSRHLAELRSALQGSAA